MPTPTPTPTPTPPATKIVGKPAVSTTFAATANLAAVDYDVGRAQSASGGPVAEASLVYDTGPNSFPLATGSEEFVRSEGRRVGNEGVSTCSSRWSPYH